MLIQTGPGIENLFLDMETAGHRLGSPLRYFSIMRVEHQMIEYALLWHAVADSGKDHLRCRLSNSRRGIWGSEAFHQIKGRLKNVSWRFSWRNAKRKEICRRLLCAWAMSCCATLAAQNTRLSTHALFWFEGRTLGKQICFEVYRLDNITVRYQMR